MNTKTAEYGRWKCESCNLVFSTRRELFEHNHICENRIRADKIIINEDCPFCGRHFTNKSGFTNHKSLCYKNPDRDLEKIERLKNAQKKAWQSPELRKKASENTVFNNFWKYRSKNPIIYESKIAGKVKLYSNWELIVAKRLDDLNVEWYRPRIRLPYLDNTGVEHGYFPDFYVKTYNCFIEVKSDFIAKFQNSNNKIEYVKEHYKFVKWLETEDQCRTFVLSDLGCSFMPEKDNDTFYRIEANPKEKKSRKNKIEANPKEKKSRKNKILENERWKIIQNSKIDFSKFGWVNKLSKLFGISENKAGKYVQLHYPEFYETCYVRKKKLQVRVLPWE